MAERGMAFVGWGTAADGVGMAASLWAKVPAERGCVVVSPALVLWATGALLVLPAVTPEPDAEGWCRYEKTLRAENSATVMYVETSLQGDETALLDDARVVPDTGADPMSAVSPPQPSAAYRARVKAALDWIRVHRPFGRPLPLRPSHPTE